MDSQERLINLEALRKAASASLTSLVTILGRISDEVTTLRDESVVAHVSNVAAITSPEIDIKEYYNTIPESDFPLTPIECWYIMRGYGVKPKQIISINKILTYNKNITEDSNGYLKLGINTLSTSV